MRTLFVALVAIGTSAANAADPTPEEFAAHLAEAKHLGWMLATQAFVPSLLDDEEAAKTYPGIAAFIGDVKRVAAKLDFKGKPNTFPGIDADALVTKNPNFWRANYEVAPGDPAWMTLHAGLLMAGGEAFRCQRVLVMALSRKGIPDAILNGAMHPLAAQSGRVLNEGHGFILKGVKIYDEGDRTTALKIYEDALKLWPQNGLGHFEVGMCRMETNRDAIGMPATEPDRIFGMTPEQAAKLHTPEVVAAFARSRHHDAFQWKSYQGIKDPKAKILAIGRAMKTYDKMLKGGADDPVALDDWIAMSNDLQEAEQHELALAARQGAVIRRGGFRPEDHPFLGESLRALAPGEAIESILERMAGPALVLRSLVDMKPGE